MRHVLGLMALACLLLFGCSDQPTTDIQIVAAPAPVVPPPKPRGSSGGPPEPASAAPQSVPIADGIAALTPENSRIEFIGTHTGDKPDPRTGGFETFSGKAEVDPAAKALKSVAVEIDTASVWTQFPPLTNHLNSPDFFDAREYPKARFQSTQIAPEGEGKATITGNLTLLAMTKEISFPATVTVNDAGLTLRADLTIDRTEFGMDKVQDRVEKEVKLTVAIGEKTQPQRGPGGFGGGPGGRGGPGGGRPGGNFDPAAFFKQRDADGDGKLTGDEISDRMRGDLAAIDTDGDGAVSQDEFQARARQRSAGGRPGGPGGPGAPPKGQPEPSQPEGKQASP